MSRRPVPPRAHGGPLSCSRVLATIAEEIETLRSEQRAITTAIEALESTAKSLGNLVAAPPAARPANRSALGASPTSSSFDTTLGRKVERLLEAEPERLFSTGEILAALGAEGAIHAQDPEAAMRILLTRLLGRGRIARGARGRYSARHPH